MQTRAKAAPGRAFEIVAPIDLSLIFTGWELFLAASGVKHRTAA